MAKYVITCMGYAIDHPCDHIGQWLEWYDPHADAWGGAIVAGWTADPQKAMKFDQPSDAMTKWKEPLLDEHDVPRQRKNGTGIERPLTAYTVAIDPVAS